MIGHQAIRSDCYQWDRALFLKDFFQSRFFQHEEIYCFFVVCEVEKHKKTLRIVFVFKDVTFIDSSIETVVPFIHGKSSLCSHPSSITYEATPHRFFHTNNVTNFP